MNTDPAGSKARRTATGMVSGLLVLSALCLATRSAVEMARRNEEDGARTENGRKEADAINQPQRPRHGAGNEEVTLDRRLRAALASGNGAERTRRLLDLMQDFRPQDWAGALATLRGLGMEKSEAFSMILAGWMEQEPKIALRWTLEQKLQLGEMQVWKLIKIWVAQDPDTALREVKALDQVYPKTKLLQTAISTLTASDLPRATQEMEAICAKGGGFYLLEMMASEVVRLEPGAIRQWIASLEPTIRKTAIDRMMVSMPQSKIDVMLGLMRDYPEIVTPVYYPQVYSTWARADETAAMTSFEAMEPGDGHRRALEGLVSYLSFRGQPERGMALMDQHPEDVDDRTIESWLSGNHDDREKQIAEVPRIQDESRRIRAYETLLSEWRMHDPAAVEKWVSGHELPEKLRQEFGGR